LVDILYFRMGPLVPLRIGAEHRPPRATMQSLLRRLSALADTERQEVVDSEEEKKPRWMERR
jgi:hypothetical protein